MSGRELVDALLEANRSEPYGNTCSAKLGYLMAVLASLADRHPEVADDLHSRLNTKRELSQSPLRNEGL